MGHRALIAYERPDSTYNLHYTHWGGMHLRLKREISRETPFGDDKSNEASQSICEQLLEAATETAIQEALDGRESPSLPVDIDPWATRLTLDEILTDYLDCLHHEAFYVVDRDFGVTAYRTHWFGLQYDCAAVETAPTVGNGALRTVRWHDGEPVGDGFAQGEFRALKAVVGDLIDRSVLTQSEAIEFMEQKLDEWVGDSQELIVRRPHGIE
ncbi:DUF6735 family protein [Halosimplex amylolyticum]|uniref:DUF6735 family protein n=1 Tax=Halosimplex amylolyticum TaxID=3396616 RepID=UPI003F574A1F